MERRDFVKQISALAGWSILSPTASRPNAADATYPAYENNLRDRLWMWGYDPGVYDGPKGVYNIPLSAPMSLAEGIKRRAAAMLKGPRRYTEHTKRKADVAHERGRSARLANRGGAR